jgi:hypothetical protein
VITWYGVKEAFFFLGSLAGFAAVGRAVLERKFNRDAERTRYVLELAPEMAYRDLEFNIWGTRAVPDEIFLALGRFEFDLRDNSEQVRFSGPLRRHLLAACEEMVDRCNLLRELIQVDLWEPIDDGKGGSIWRFNKSAFNGPEGYPVDYIAHLDRCVDRAQLLVKAHQRLQVINEMHFFEVVFASWLLPRRFKKYGVGDPK